MNKPLTFSAAAAALLMMVGGRATATSTAPTFPDSVVRASLTAQARPGEAQDSSFVVRLLQEGPNVVATGSGTINLTGLGPPGLAFSGDFMIPNLGWIVTGPATLVDQYSLTLTGPLNFGIGHETASNSGTGDTVGILPPSNRPAAVLEVPVDYESNSPLSNTSTWDNTTIEDLGVTPGKYVWRWGSGANAGSFTLAVPEPATLGLMVLGLLGGAGFAGRKRRS